ncbi:polyprenyl diphosphate synthase [candidate division KSB1 bacterium]
MQNETQEKTPSCIGMIMDGNRRWAKERGLSSIEGHRQGHEKLKEVVEWMKEVGVPNLIVYAFSTENWSRPKEEVSFLMELLKKVLSEEIEEFNDKGVRLIFAGDLGRFSEDIQKLMKEASEKTKNNSEHTLVLCVSYGGRTEVIHAVNNLLKEGKESINEEDFSQTLWTKDVPDPDIIIRTSGEKRLSGFLPWQSVYSELFFPKTYWPAFSKEEFLDILKEFSSRERRRGK